MANGHLSLAQRQHVQRPRHLEKTMAGCARTNASIAIIITTGIAFDRSTSNAVQLNERKKCMTDKYRAANLAIVGAYISEGLFSPRDGDNSERRRAILDSAPGGHIGVVAEACAYAEYALDLCDAASVVTDDFPGVWEYEVIDCFGNWYGDKIIETSRQGPTAQQVRVYLLNATWAFFKQCWDGNDPVDEDELAKAMFAVPFMNAKENT